jgi:hypothetical protein
MTQQRHHEVFEKDPNDILIRGIEWDSEGYLAARNTTITSSSWIVPSGLTLNDDTNTTTTTLFELAGGTADANYTITNRVVLANGEQRDRSILIRVRQQ